MSGTTSLDVSSSSSSSHLDWTQRPKNVQEAIDETFEKISSFTDGNWLYNGSDEYMLCEVQEHELMKKIIQLAPKEQREFYALDIGSGNFQWSSALANFLARQTDLPKDIRVNIIGVRGEQYFGEKVYEVHQCRVYDIGAFKIEELFREFKKAGLDLENKVDLMISRWTFRHLVDPVGTFAQAYNLLRPNGFFLLDGFCFLRNFRSLFSVGNHDMTWLLSETNAPFLENVYNGCRSLNHFVLRRPDGLPIQLRMKYKDVETTGDNCQIESRRVVRFQTEEREKEIVEDIGIPVDFPEKMIEYKHEFLFGSKKLYQWFKQNDVLGSPSIGWYPLEEKDGSIPTSSPLHKAVMSKDLREVEKCLKDGANVNEVDEMGDTPLHIAVRNLREKRQDAQGCLVMSEEALALCRLLLKNGANPSLFNVAHHTALHEAVRTDDEGVCLQLLLDAKANVNAHVSHYYKPLGMAVDAKNIKAIEILIKAGAVIADYDFKQLHDPAFASLRGILEKCVADGGIWGPTTYHYVEK